jgi:Uncharacterized protein conserved in bacteria (DUF2242)
MHKILTAGRASILVTRIGLVGASAIAAAGLSACASKPTAQGPFTGTAPFSRTIAGPSDNVCWSVKRALLGQGYMLDRSTEPGVLTGSRDYQPKEKINVTVHLQTTCADNHDGTSIVFATAEREENKLQKMKQTTSAGIGPATLTMPAGSARVLGTIRRETIADPAFYNSFFTLVQNYVAQEGRVHPDEPTALRRDSAPAAAQQ